MKIPAKIAFISVLISLMVSCTVYRDIPIEVLNPKVIDIPINSSVALLYRNFKYENDTLQYYIRENYNLEYDPRGKKANVDSLVSMSILNTLASQPELLQNTSDIVVFDYYSLPRMTGQNLIPLSREVIQNIARSSGSQKVISLETLTYMYSWYSYISGGNESADVIIAAIWAVYDGFTGALLQNEQVIDTLYWTTSLSFKKGNKEPLVPPYITAMELASETYAENFAKKFAISWETVQRIIVVPPMNEFNLAANYALENEWEKASEIWKRYTSERYGRLAVSARFNMAVASEISDRIDIALDWIAKAEELTKVYRNKNENELVRSYKEILNDRKKDIERLKKSEQN